MKTYIPLVVILVCILSSCGTEQKENQVVDKNDNVSRIEEEKLAGTDCAKLSQETQMNLVEKNTKENISFDFLGAIYDEQAAACLLKVKINNTETPNTPIYSLFNIVTQKTQKTFGSIEEMNAEILTLGIEDNSEEQASKSTQGGDDDMSSSIEITPSEGTDTVNIEDTFKEQRQASGGIDFIGLSEEAATQLAKENNIPFRVVTRDGEPLPATMDYRPGRINAEVEDGIVTDYSVE